MRKTKRAWYFPLFAVMALLLLSAGNARASAISGTCNTVNIDDISLCIFSWGSGPGQSAHLTLNPAAATTAGINYFANYLKATYTTAGAPKGYNAGNSMTWGQPPGGPPGGVVSNPVGRFR